MGGGKRVLGEVGHGGWSGVLVVEGFMGVLSGLGVCVGLGWCSIGGRQW